MLSTPLTCCSMGVATDCSRVFASAPTNVACNRISGGTMLGNCATGRLAIVTAPIITIRIDITIATIGRLMKNFDIDSVSFSGKTYGLGSNGSSFLELLQSFDYNLLTRLEAAVNHPHRSDRLAGFHGAHTDFVITPDDRRLIASLRLSNGALRYEQSAFFHFRFDMHTSILPGTQNVARIREGSDDANRARAGIHLPVGQQDFAFSG